MRRTRSIADILASNVKAERAKRKWSQAEVAARSSGGIDAKTVSNIENRTNATQLDKLDAIARAFGMAPWRLLVDEAAGDFGHDGELAHLIEDFQRTDETGKHSILAVADVAARPYRNE